MEAAMDQLIYNGYERRSSEDSEDKQVASIPSQHRELTDLQKKQGLNVRRYISESKSAHKIGRIGFNELLDDIEKGKCNAILTFHPNRLCRNPFDAGRLIYLIDEGKLLEIRTPSSVCRNTPSDKFMLSLEFGMSKKDSDDKGIVVKRGLKTKLLAGWRPGNAPQGYLNDKGSEIGTRRIFTDPDRFPFIQQIFQLKLDGISVIKICKIAKDEWGFRTKQRKIMGGKPLSKSMIYYILTNPFYAGKYEYPLGSGDWYDGKHEKAISWEVFEKIQIMLGNKGFKAKAHTKEFSYTGLIQCGECRGLVTAEEKNQVICSECKVKFSLTQKNNSLCPGCKILIENMSKPKLLHYVYYHCTKRKNPNCTQKSIELTKLEEQVAEQVNQIEINDTFMEWAINEINQENDKDQDFQVNKSESLNNAHDNCRQRIANLLRLKISPNNTNGEMLSDEKFQVENKTLETELKSLDDQIAKLDEYTVKRSQEIADKFDFAVQAKERFATGGLTEKRKVLTDLGSNLSLKDKILTIELPEIFISIQRMKKAEPLAGKLIEPKDQSLTKAQLTSAYSQNPTLLRE